jgi:prepilin-type N-terminal cleavage/methylation domain-containing protein
MIRRGMSVLELLMALTVTGLAASIGAATLALLADRRAPLLETSSAAENAAAARRTLVEWIEGAHAAPSPFSGNASAVFQLLDRTVQGRARDELLFTTSAPTPLGKADAFVRLYVDVGERSAQRGLIAELFEYPGGPTLRLPLDSTVSELDIRCLTDLLGTTRWVPTFLSSQVVPRGVELRLRSARPEALHPLLRLPIRAVLEAGR